MTRILLAARLQMIAWNYWLAWVWGILALSFVINLGVFGVAQSQMNGNETTGGLLSIYIMVFVGCLTAMLQMFPLAVGLSLSRRAFYFGTWLHVTAEAAAYALVVLLLKLVEDATNGWGVSMRFFGIPFLRQDNILLQYLVYFTPFLLAAALGMVIGAVGKRWGTAGVLTLIALSIVVPGLLAILFTWQQWWVPIGRWLADQSGLSVAVAMPALLTAALCVMGYTIVRRATP
jgi:hypothetical protein